MENHLKTTWVNLHILPGKCIVFFVYFAISFNFRYIFLVNKFEWLIDHIKTVANQQQKFEYAAVLHCVVVYAWLVHAPNCRYTVTRPVLFFYSRFSLYKGKIENIGNIKMYVSYIKQETLNSYIQNSSVVCKLDCIHTACLNKTDFPSIFFLLNMRKINLVSLKNLSKISFWSKKIFSIRGV